MVNNPTGPKRDRGAAFRHDMSGIIEELARIQEQMKAHVQLLGRIEIQYNERLSNQEKLLKENCVTADTALFEAKNNTDRIDIMKWVIGGITVFLTTALAIILQVILTR